MAGRIRVYTDTAERMRAYRDRLKVAEYERLAAIRHREEEERLERVQRDLWRCGVVAQMLEDGLKARPGCFNKQDENWLWSHYAEMERRAKEGWG